MRTYVHVALVCTSLFIATPSDAHALPLVSEGGFTFDVSLSDGAMLDGTDDTYDGCYAVSVSTGGRMAERYHSDGVDPVLTLDGRQQELSRSVIGGVAVRRLIYVPATGGDYARYVDTFVNEGSDELVATITYDCNLGSDASTVIYADSSGDMTADVSDSWFGTDDSANGDTIAAHVIQGIMPSSRTMSVSQRLDVLRWSYVITIPAGGRTALLMYAIQGSSRSSTVAQTSAVADPSADALVGLDDYLGDIANFDLGGPVVVADAGVPLDAGTFLDAGTLTDAGAVDDAGNFVDASSMADARTVDAATDERTHVQYGCGCNTAGETNHGVGVSLLALLTLFGVLLARGRRGTR